MDAMEARASCEVCNAKVAELRRGRCWGCYTRWAEHRAVGLGATCAICADPRREHLRLVELHAQWTPMCHNCGARAARLTPMPESVDALRTRLTRDRRARDRRDARPDTRVFPRERRTTDRRTAGDSVRSDGSVVTLGDDDLVLIDHEQVLQVLQGDETRIVERI